MSTPLDNDLATFRIGGSPPLPYSLVSQEDRFTFKVISDSSVDAAIYDEDSVVIRCQREYEKGEIVAATINGEGTARNLLNVRRSCLAVANQ